MCTTQVECMSRHHPSIHPSIFFLKKDGWIGPRADKEKKKQEVLSITIMCTYDFGGCWGFISAPFLILRKKGGLVSSSLLKPIGLGFRVSCHLVHVIGTFRV